MKTNDEIEAKIEFHLDKSKHHEERLRHYLHIAQKRARQAGLISTPVAPMSGGTGEDKPDPEAP
jgi:hypothetical protein